MPNELFHFKHIMHTTSEYTRGQLVSLLEEQVEQFPHSVELLKMLLDVSRRQRRQVFLSRAPGQGRWGKSIIIHSLVS